MAVGTGDSARLAALGELWGNRALRRAELAWGGFHAAEWASLVALTVVASVVSGRPCDSHSFRPPFISATSVWPYIRATQ